MINPGQLQKIGAGRTATIFRCGQKHVLKLYKPTFPRKAIDDEFQIGLTLNHLGLDIPKTYEIVDLNGNKGIVLDYISGSSMLENLASKPWLVFSYSKHMARLHFKMHTTPIVKNQSISFLKESLADKIARVSLLSLEEKNAILSHLSALKDGSSICHGDFHPDNIIISSDGLVTVDWITATIGNPMADVARTWLLLTRGTLPENKTALEIFLAKNLRDLFCRGYIREYQKLSNFASAEFEKWKLPVAAARLIENVSDLENQSLLSLIRLEIQKDAKRVFNVLA
jgi:serine/threonine protein kinase